MKLNDLEVAPINSLSVVSVMFIVSYDQTAEASGFRWKVAQYLSFLKTVSLTRQLATCRLQLLTGMHIAGLMNKSERTISYWLPKQRSGFASFVDSLVNNVVVY